MGSELVSLLYSEDADLLSVIVQSASFEPFLQKKNRFPMTIYLPNIPFYLSEKAFC